ncbi:MAG: hypothetical protein ACJA0N_002252 [Pseudohongiellaceae bacterium]|jgi:uncharacterized protein YbaP (TraB family)
MDKHRMKNQYMCYVLLVFISINVWGGSPVWKIAKGSHQLYLAGTVHVLAQSDYPLPVAFDEAYKASSVLVFESDMAKIQSLEFQQAMLQAMVYTDGRSLKSVLNTRRYADLSALVKERGLTMDMFADFKPSMLMLTLTMLELKRLGLGEAGVDAFFHTKAQRDNKSLGQLEGPGQQLAFISALGEGRENELMAYALEDIKALPVLMGEMKRAWIKGDLGELSRIGIEPMRKAFPNMYNNILVKRNANWMPQIEKMLTTAEIELILVGALHLAGQEGLLNQLEKKGYGLTNLKNNETSR